MGLVNGIETDLDRFQEIHILILRQGFGSYIEQFGLTRKYILFHQVDSGLVERRIQIVRQSLLLTHAVDDIHLILHQGNQWRNDNGCPLHNQGGQLIAQTLSSTGRHENEGIVTCKDIPDNRFLVSLEGIETEVLLQFFGQVNFVRHQLYYYRLFIRIHPIAS